jgi:hypothetical protein
MFSIFFIRVAYMFSNRIKFRTHGSPLSNFFRAENETSTIEVPLSLLEAISSDFASSYLVGGQQ